MTTDQRFDILERDVAFLRDLVERLITITEKLGDAVKPIEHPRPAPEPEKAVLKPHGGRTMIDSTLQLGFGREAEA